MKYIDLAKEINDWFENNKNNTSKWSNNIVGQTIKQNLINTNNWKYAPRGNPRKGFEIMQDKIKNKEVIKDDGHDDFFNS